MIAPCDARSSGSACFDIRNVPRALTAKTCSQTSSGVSGAVVVEPVPAALTSTSRRGPSSSGRRSNSAVTASSSATSTGAAAATPPAARIAAAVAATGSSRRPAARIAAPSAANKRAIACPMPDPAPVTSAVMPASRLPTRAASVSILAPPGIGSSSQNDVTGSTCPRSYWSDAREDWDELAAGFWLRTTLMLLFGASEGVRKLAGWDPQTDAGEVDEDDDQLAADVADPTPPVRPARCLRRPVVRGAGKPAPVVRGAGLRRRRRGGRMRIVPQPAPDRDCSLSVRLDQPAGRATTKRATTEWYDRRGFHPSLSQSATVPAAHVPRR
jgi:hypothetical protein